MTPYVLVVEDEDALATLLHYNLEKEGYRVSLAADGEEALTQVNEQLPDLIVLDWMLPKVSGIEVCRRLRGRSETRNVPIIMLTARGEETDRIRGLDTGADDYVCKPFAPREVIARIRALLRRSEGKLVANPNPWFVDENAFRIRLKGEWLPLTRVEFLILRLLLSRSGRVFSRDHLLNTIHATQKDISDRAIDTHVKNLRKKMMAAGSDDCIRSIYGAGYKMQVV